MNAHYDREAAEYPSHRLEVMLRRQETRRELERIRRRREEIQQEREAEALEAEALESKRQWRRTRTTTRTAKINLGKSE